jgi:hypothetical protein
MRAWDFTRSATNYDGRRLICKPEPYETKRMAPDARRIEQTEAARGIRNKERHLVHGLMLPLRRKVFIER